MPLAFNHLVFDEIIYGTTAVYTDPKWNRILGQADKLTMLAMVSEVAGTNPTLSVQIEISGDNRNFGGKDNPEINAVALTAGTQNMTLGKDQTTWASLAFVRLKISLGGTSPVGRLRLHVTGRYGF